MQFPAIIPFSKNRVWRTYLGGRLLDQMEGRGTQEDTHYPEDWIGSTTVAVNPGSTSIEDGLSRVVVDGGAMYLRDLLEGHGEQLLGAQHVAAFGPAPGFLLKFLDSSIRLHIQCHPDIGFARKHLGVNNGKTEAYVILKIREEENDPHIYFGFQKETSRDEFKRAIVEQDSPSLLAPFERIPVKEGDIFIVPGGLPHAIGAGVFMVEIMEPTDLTVRFEFEREGIVLPESARFMNRGIDFALDMVDFQALSIEQLKQRYFVSQFESRQIGDNSSVEELIGTAHTKCFRAERWMINDVVDMSQESFYYAIVLEGQGTILAVDQELRVEAYDRFMIPHSTGSIQITPEGSVEILAVYPPGS